MLLHDSGRSLTARVDERPFAFPAMNDPVNYVRHIAETNRGRNCNFDNIVRLKSWTGLALFGRSSLVAYSSQNLLSFVL
jgi:hypothetical protein